MPGLLEQLLVPEHRPDVEAVGDHVGRVLDHRAELDRAVGQLLGLGPLVHPGLQALELVVVGVERQPAVGHLDHVGDLAALDHGRQLLERLAPGQGGHLDLHARVGRLELGDHALEQLGPLRAGDHLGELQRGVRLRLAGEQGHGQRRADDQPLHVCLPLLFVVLSPAPAERPRQVVDQVLRRLEPDMQPHDTRADAEIDGGVRARPPPARARPPPA